MADQVMAATITGEGSVPDASVQVSMHPESVEGPGHTLGALTVAQALPLLGAAATGEADILEANLVVLTRVAPTSRAQNVKHGGRVTWEDF